GRGGAQGLYGVEPDLTVLGKVRGGGLPAAALGGPRQLLERLAPAGDVYQAGTLSGNPLAVAAGLATLRELDAGAYARLGELAERLRREQTVISSHVVDPVGPPVLGPLAAAGPRAASAADEYSLVIEAIREGYELHYGSPRILAGHDDDLALLAGDYLYALGLERLAAMRDAEAVAELSDLISLCAAAHADGDGLAVPALWIA